MSDTTSQPAAGNSLDQLAAHAEQLVTGTGEKIAVEDHAATMNGLHEVYQRVLTEAAAHYNEARRVLDEALHRGLGNTRT